MKQVIIIAPQFPPSNLTATHRSRYFATHLPKFGWRVKVLSVEPSYYEEELDYELEKLLPPSLDVVRTKAFPARPLRLIGDIGIRSLWHHYRAVSDMVSREKIDLIYIPIPPNFSATLGPLIFRRFGIPYAIDYIDPWVHPWPGCETLFSKAWFSYQLGRIFEPIVLRHASLITAVAPGYYEGALARYAWLSSSTCVALPYGAEEEDFIYLDKHPRPTYIFNPRDGLFHFVYAGAMLPKAYSTVEALMKGLFVFKGQNPELANKLRFHFIGTVKDAIHPKNFDMKSMAAKFCISDIIHEYPKRIPYLDTLNHLKNSYAVLILGSSEAHYTPSKVFQAVLSKRPVLALLHSKSTAAGVIKNSNAGAVISFDEKREAKACAYDISKAIYRIVTHDYSSHHADWQALRAYSAEAMAKMLADAFNSALYGKKYDVRL